MMNEYFDCQGKSLEQIKKPIIGWTCAYVPEEIIIAAGAHPFRLHGKEMQQDRCGEYLPNFFCPYGANIANAALEGEYRFLDAMIFANSCNAMERVYDLWNEYVESGHGYMLDVPRENSIQARKYFKSALKGLVNNLEMQFQIEITEDDLKKAIEQTNQTRKLLKKLSYLALDGSSSFSTKEFLEVVDACSYMERHRYNDALEKMVQDLTSCEKKKGKRRSRILLAGCTMNNYDLIDMIEHSGGVVVGDELCTGSRYYELQIEESGEPLENICQAYLGKSPCPRMEGSASLRCKNLLGFIEENDIDAVVYHSLKFCINHSYDFMQMKECLNEEGIPILFAESTFNESGMEQLRIRVEAFMEMLS